MVKNTLGDLNNFLFAQLERLDNEELEGDKLKEEMDRAKAVTQVATQIINNGSLVLRAQTLQAEYSGKVKELPNMLEG